MATKVIIKQFKNKAKKPVAGLTPEHAIYDTNGVRLDAKLGNINLSEFRKAQDDGIKALKNQEKESLEILKEYDHETIINNGTINNAADEEDITVRDNVLSFKDRTYTEGINEMGYIILRKNKSFAEQVIKENTIYEIKYDFDLRGLSVSIPFGSILQFKGGSVNNGTISLNDSYISGSPIINASLSGTIKNVTIYSDWFINFDNFILSCNNLYGYYEIKVATGNYTATKGFDLTDRDVFIDFGNSKITVSESINTFIFLGNNTSTQLAILTAAAKTGDMTISVSSSLDINVGDILVLQDSTSNSYNTYRDYHEGEFIQVAAINETTLTLVSPLLGNYIESNIANCKILKYSMHTCGIVNGNFEMQRINSISEKTLIKAYALINSQIDSINGNGIDVNISLELSYNCLIERCVFSNQIVKYNNKAFDQYGVTISNCQFVNVRQIHGQCGNHIVSVTGSFIVSRFINFIDCSGNTNKNEYYGMNVHGSSEYISFIRCVTNGFDLGGDYLILQDCIVYPNNEGISISLFEITGYNIKIENCELHGGIYNRSTSLSGVNRTLAKHIFKMINCKWNNTRKSELCRKTTFAESVDVVIDGCYLNGVNGSLLIGSPNFVFKFSNCHITDFLVNIYKVERIKFIDNFIKNSATGRFIQTNNNGVAIQEFIMTGNEFESISSYKDINLIYMGAACQFMRIENNLIKKLNGSGFILECSGTSVWAEKAVVNNNIWWINSNYAKIRATTFYNNNNFLIGTAGHLLLETV